MNCENHNHSWNFLLQSSPALFDIFRLHLALLVSQLLFDYINEPECTHALHGRLHWQIRVTLGVGIAY